MSSRLTIDAYGRLIAEGTCLELRGLRWLVVDMFELGFVRPGRPPTAREREAAQRYAPYRPAWSRQERERETPDEQLAEEAAIQLARLEQQRQPPDLVNVAA
jgi:hypothetical protein